MALVCAAVMSDIKSSHVRKTMMQMRFGIPPTWETDQKIDVRSGGLHVSYPAPRNPVRFSPFAGLGCSGCSTHFSRKSVKDGKKMSRIAFLLPGLRMTALLMSP